MRGRPFDNWQSFADIAMAFMATLLLVLVVLWREKSQEAEAHQAEAEKLAQFAEALLDALDEADQIVARQDGVAEWISFVFRETGCFLDFNPKTKTLEPRAGKATELYKPGEVRLSARAIDELRSCQDAFRQLAACMSDSPEVRAVGCPLEQTGEWSREIAVFREDVEALVIQGNTDRVAYGNASRIRGARGSLRPLAKSFVSNAELGAERARQALGHLMLLVEGEDDGEDTDTSSPLQVLMGRARVESPAFGRYQVGPLERRAAHDCGDSLDCAAARNLSLRLRWRTKSLREPFKKVRDTFCAEWTNPTSQLRESVRNAKQRARAHMLCSGEDRGP